jgi:hypothetical protein
VQAHVEERPLVILGRLSATATEKAEIIAQAEAKPTKRALRLFVRLAFTT